MFFTVFDVLLCFLKDAKRIISLFEKLGNHATGAAAACCLDGFDGRSDNAHVLLKQRCLCGRQRMQGGLTHDEQLLAFVVVQFEHLAGKQMPLRKRDGHYLLSAGLEAFH